MKLYYAPGACSVGIHVLLEEIGEPYEARKLNFADGEQYRPEFTAINPKSKVPTLVRDDGSVLTEFPAIALWLARTHPDAGLLPAGLEAEARALESMDYVVGTLHGQGFARMLRPGNFAPSEADHDKVKARGREIFEKGLKLMDGRLGDKPYLAGDAFSVADAALFYVCFWAVGRMKMTLPANLAGFYERVKARPAVAKVMAAEGLSG